MARKSAPMCNVGPVRPRPPNLHAVLASHGWTHHEAPGNTGKRIIRDATGAEIGRYNAGDAWDMLRARGMYRDEDYAEVTYCTVNGCYAVAVVDGIAQNAGCEP